MNQATSQMPQVSWRNRSSRQCSLVITCTRVDMYLRVHNGFANLFAIRLSKQQKPTPEPGQVRCHFSRVNQKFPPLTTLFASFL
jgi:hypothetical protein